MNEFYRKINNTNVHQRNPWDPQTLPKFVSAPYIRGARMAFFWRTKILEVLFWYVPCQASIPYKYGRINEVYNVLRIVSGRKRFSLYKSSLLTLQLS